MYEHVQVISEITSSTKIYIEDKYKTGPLGHNFTEINGCI